MMKYVIFFLCLGSRGVLAQLPYSVGYRSVYLKDSGRVYKPGSAVDHPLHYRPLEIDLWYPATMTGPGAPIPFGRFIGLLEQRADRFQDDTSYDGLTRDLVQYLCANLNVDSGRLLQLPTAGYLNAKPVSERFPLIIYLCSFNGICYENVPLFESLASRGYVVASITSVGRYPGNMTTKTADLLEQVADGLFALQSLKQQPNVDGRKIGVIGYSWGGLAAVTMAMKSASIRAIFSLDGSELHYYGTSTEEDKDFDSWRTSPFFDLDNLHAPYTYLESGGKQKDRPADSIFDLLPLLAVPTRYLHFSGAEHEDFSCLPSLPARLSAAAAARQPIAFDRLAIAFFDSWLKDSVSVYHDWRWVARADSTYPVVSRRPGFTIRISGTTIESSDMKPLPFVNAGIPGKNIGTVSREDGTFDLQVDEGLRGDSVRFSMAGYRTVTYPITVLVNTNGHVTVPLQINAVELPAAMLTSKITKTRRIGNGTRSTFMSVGFPLRALGTEMGIRMDLGKKPVRLKRLQFNLASSRVDTALFRLNIHRFKNGKPGENLLGSSVVIPVGKKSGAYSIDLSSYNIVLNGDVLVSLEWIGGSSAAGPGAIFFSAGFLNSATWRRETSQGNWKKASGIGVGLSLFVQPLQ